MERDHSLKGYLQRQSTEKLKWILLSYGDAGKEALDENDKAMILKVLGERENPELSKISTEWQNL